MLATSAFGMTGAGAAEPQRLAVVASFSILGDLARQIGGDRITVTDIIGPNRDAHGFEPSPADARKLAGARLVLVNGLGFDNFIDKLMKAAGNPARVVTVSSGLPLLRKAAEKPDHGHGHSHAGGKAKDDPHLWQSPANVRQMARTIAAAFSAADEAGKATYDANLAAFLARLDVLDQEFRTAIARIPEARRTFATNHDAFGYLAREYGLTIHAIQGVSPHAEASAADLARIIRQLKAAKAPAVFLENVTDSRAVARIARESGAKVGGTLYSDALSLADGPAPSYIDLMRHNMKEIAAALAP